MMSASMSANLNCHRCEKYIYQYSRNLEVPDYRKIVDASVSEIILGSISEVINANISENRVVSILEIIVASIWEIIIASIS